MGESGKNVKIHCYSGQTLNFVEILKKQNRKDLANVKGSTFTYSQEYLSQVENELSFYLSYYISLLYEHNLFLCFCRILL